MSKYWLRTVGLTMALGISLLGFAGSGHAALQEPNCGHFKADKSWGSAEGKVCWKGGRSEGKVRDKEDDGKCVWVRLWYKMEDGSTKTLDSSKACGKGKVKSVANSSPKKSVSVKGSLMRG
ncbi:hypothetical protein JOF56_007956 [Kibdelosporangium banguiense]|uniref:Uncharacterized protein n=1 Tax=Kibdelosporangium banguiense TaxID=1365924 RepID=A0ABS4TT46_9PSEU|nr:hypothetical protein [Kibdelosporangium banguiense]MBP2327571.1 hypothetical protein [Kibdelosporangium banguiense]